jgi:hypothetical protein
MEVRIHTVCRADYEDDDDNIDNNWCRVQIVEFLSPNS